MRRRFFLLASRFFLVARAADFFAPRNTARPKRRRPPARQKRGILLLVSPPASWRAERWSDVPPSGEVIKRGVPMSLAEARIRAKLINQLTRDLEDSPWAIVVATDARLVKGGAV